MGPPGDPAAMRIGIPRLGLTHPFLLRGILAFSAFHLAYLNPEKRSRFRLLALRHQSLALRGLGEELQHVTAEKSHAMFLTSLLLVITKFAGFPNCDNHDDHNCCSPIQSLVEVFSVCSGGRAILCMFEDDISRGPLAFMFSKGYSNESGEKVLPLLLGRLFELKATLNSRRENQTVLEAVDVFIDCAARISEGPRSTSPPELSASIAWPMLMPAQFSDLLAKRNHAALAVLSHYCVLIQRAEKVIWCFEGWHKLLLREITAELRGAAWEGTVERVSSLMNTS